MESKDKKNNKDKKIKTHFSYREESKNLKKKKN